MGASRTFTSSTNRVSLSSPTILDDIWSGGGTIAVWGYPTSFSGEKVFIGNSASSAGYNLALESSTGNLRLFVQFSSAFGLWDGTNSALNQWSHYAVTYDSDSTSNNPTFYFNGVSESVTEANAPSGTYASGASNDIQIGNNLANSDPFEGNICYVQMFNRILTAGEILECMYKPGSIANGLVGYWPLLGESPERDLSGNGNTGTVTGTSVSFDGAPVTRF